ncbi:MAG: hypothetical protein WC389_15000, partial [Lutibacter sp.]
ENLADYSGYNELEVLENGLQADVQFSDIDEAYNGHFSNDEDFAYQMADELGYLDDKKSWPYTCIDWEQAAKELMYDYSENGGYYFRNF